MKNKDLKLRIMRFGISEGKHWLVWPDSLPYPERISRNFGRYKDARQYALKHAYARNIRTIE